MEGGLWYYKDFGGFLLGLVCPHHKSWLVGWQFLHERLCGTLLQAIILHDQSLVFLNLEIVMISKTPAYITDPQPSL